MFSKCISFGVVLFLIYLRLYSSMKLDVVNCGIDHEDRVSQGKVPISKYPWLGVLYYAYIADGQETRSVTTVTLIHKNFVVGCAADIGPMPKDHFRRDSRVLLGRDWTHTGLRVRNYVLHPEYEETRNTIAIIHLKDSAPRGIIVPVCPPPDTLRDPVFYVVKFRDDFNDLQKEVIPVGHIPAAMCEDFYIKANLYDPGHRPPYVACAVSLDEDSVCVWRAGAALVSRDVWGRWQFLGLGVRGPGCGAPSRFLDMGMYYPWIEHALGRFTTFTVSKINKHKFVLRSTGSTDLEEGSQVVRYGDCDNEERSLTLQYRELLRLESDSKRFQFLTYNLTIRDTVRYDCLTLELTNASASSEMKLTHICPQKPKLDRREPCHTYLGSSFDISIFIMYSGRCQFQLYAWGELVDLSLLDTHKWKWEEGTYYEDFTNEEVEYRGQSYMTDFGFEPLDRTMWIPDYDSWTTEFFDNRTTTTWDTANFTGEFKFMTTTPPPDTRKTKRWIAANFWGDNCNFDFLRVRMVFMPQVFSPVLCLASSVLVQCTYYNVFHSLFFLEAATTQAAVCVKNLHLCKFSKIKLSVKLCR